MSYPPPPFDPGGADDALASLLDEFLRRHRAGECPSVDDYAQRHPELAARIQELFPAAMLVEQDAAVPSGERVGAMVGRYRLLERIGEGGFGMVYMAEQLTPVRRRVALKVIKPGVETRQVIGRFEAERQALAMMDHENIARVLDAGATDSGRPYFVMELVRGVPITDFCDQNQLSPPERLALFVQVCRAVQHAHTKGIIHRDLKPTNVLVTMQDGRAVPKVIDFGVAKATGPPLTEATLFTNFAQMVGTPLYMSPEQAEMTTVDVDTRSDVYSLGVLLYELLTGTTPVDKERLKQAAFDEVRRIIREEEPPRPSTRLSTMGERARRTVCAHRKCDPKSLGRLVRGELDWIVMKALEKERSRRYETAIGLARDVERHLADEPVLARPPTVRYRFGKFARRHWRSLTVATAFVLLLVGAVVALSVALVAVNRERRDKEVALAAEERRRQQAREALDSMSSAVIETWLAKQPALLPEHKQFLERALGSYEEFASETGDDEASRAGVARAYLRVGFIRERLGQRSEAEAAYHRSRELFKLLAGEFPTNGDYLYALARADGGLARMFNAAGRGADAETAYRAALDHYRKLVSGFPAVAEYRSGVAQSLSNLGLVLRRLGRMSEAQASFNEAVTLFERLSEEFPDNPDFRDGLALSYMNWATLFHASPGRVREAGPELTDGSRDAISAMARGVAIYERLANEVPSEADYRNSLAMSRDQLAGVLRDLGQNSEAERIFNDALETKRALVSEFPRVPEYRRSLAITLNNLGILMKNTGRPRDAEALYRQSLSIHKSLAADFPTVPDHQSETAGAMVNLARLLFDQGEYAGARELLEAAVPYHRAALSAMPQHPAYRRFFRNNRWRLTETLLAMNDPAAAAEMAGEFLAAAVEQPRDSYTAAGLLARCAGLAAGDQRLDEPQRQARASQYGDGAVDALGRAVEMGFADFDQLRSDPDFDPIRARADFASLIPATVPATGPTTKP